ncbi:MAG: plastocyanin/azurin family copper-binding protein [Candidatus Limnocylindria bacterium]
MTFGSGSFGDWIMILVPIALVVGVVLIALWAVRLLGGGAEDDALRQLRARFARGEIEAPQFEEMRRALEATDGPRTGRSALGIVGLVLVVGAILLGTAAGWGGTTGPGWGGMMGPGGMMGWGPAPTAPAGTSVRMAGSRFEPATLTIAPGATVRWFNDDALPHTVTASDGSWDSGNLSPGGSYERRFDSPGTYAYLCRYHPGQAGSIEVRAP